MPANPVREAEAGRKAPSSGYRGWRPVVDQVQAIGQGSSQQRSRSTDCHRQDQGRFRDQAQRVPTLTGVRTMKQFAAHYVPDQNLLRWRTDGDHLDGLMGLIGRYDVDQALECGLDCTSDSNMSDYLVWKGALVREKIDVLDAQAGQQIDLKNGASISVLHPPSEPLGDTGADSNNNSVVLMLRYGEVEFLLTGDIEEFAEKYLIRNSSDLSATILKVAHHGSKSSTTSEFLDAVNPAFVVISVGADNLHGHPHPQTIRTLSERLPEERILLTSELGSIQFETDGHRLWLETER